MNINEISEKLTEFLSEYKLDEAEAFLNGSYQQAKAENNEDVQLFLLNEMAGFYRDTGNFARSVECAELSRDIFGARKDESSENYAAAMLNLANAYRAAGMHKQAHKVYNDIYATVQKHSHSLLAAYYNNLALLYEEEKDFANAKTALTAALDCLPRSDSDYERRRAITLANLSAVMTALGEDGTEQAQESVDHFKGMSPSDFHYSAALAAYADALCSKGEYEKAADMYEAALSEILLHMGRCEYYDTVSEKLAECRTHFKYKPMKGLELSRKYFEIFGKPVLKRNFADDMKYLACGLCGEGSECFGFDDERSKDHDFGASFCIFVSDNAPDELVERLEKAYSLLPREFCGTIHTESKNTSGRRGVMMVRDYYRRLVGKIPETAEDFQLIPNEQLAAAVNGEVYFDYCGEFSEIRQKLSHPPAADFLAKLAGQLEVMSKTGEYNFPRMMERGERTAAFICRAQFVLAAARAHFLIHRRLYPYEKWLFKALRQYDEIFADMLDRTASEDNFTEVIEYIKELIIKRKILFNSAPLALMAEEITEQAHCADLADKIARLEWAMFDKVQNKGGRAECQDNPQMFFIMRLSQYSAYDRELLAAIYSDYTTATEHGRNVIAEKYGYMMKYTVPDEFAEIEASLPPISEEKQQLIDAIVPIQVAMMEDYAAAHPDTAKAARVIHSYEDTPVDTSYETYMRGELATYSEDTVALYGAMIVRYAREGRNLPQEIIDRSLV